MGLTDLDYLLITIVFLARYGADGAPETPLPRQPARLPAQEPRTDHSGAAAGPLCSAEVCK